MQNNTVLSAHRTESLSVTGHKLFEAMSARVLEQMQQNVFEYITKLYIV